MSFLLSGSQLQFLSLIKAADLVVKLTDCFLIFAPRALALPVFLLLCSLHDNSTIPCWRVTKKHIEGPVHDFFFMDPTRSIRSFELDLALRPLDPVPHFLSLSPPTSSSFILGAHQKRTHPKHAINHVCQSYFAGSIVTKCERTLSQKYAYMHTRLSIAPFVFFGWTKNERKVDHCFDLVSSKRVFGMRHFFLIFFCLGWTGNRTQARCYYSRVLGCALIRHLAHSWWLPCSSFLRCSCLGSKLLIVFLLPFHWLWLHLP